MVAWAKVHDDSGPAAMDGASVVAGGSLAKTELWTCAIGADFLGAMVSHP